MRNRVADKAVTTREIYHYIRDYIGDDDGRTYFEPDGLAIFENRISDASAEAAHTNLQRILEVEKILYRNLVLEFAIPFIVGTSLFEYVSYNYLSGFSFVIAPLISALNTIASQGPSYTWNAVEELKKLAEQRVKQLSLNDSHAANTTKLDSSSHHVDATAKNENMCTALLRRGFGLFNSGVSYLKGDQKTAAEKNQEVSPHLSLGK